jgi:hypothetical protein
MLGTIKGEKTINVWPVAQGCQMVLLKTRNKQFGLFKVSLVLKYLVWFLVFLVLFGFLTNSNSQWM